MITYEEVAEWWEDSEWNMSTFPPSSWHAYAIAEGLTIEELTENPRAHEAGVEAIHSEDDGRTCECEWAEHERGCTWQK